eukprot:m51a1_g9777 hypothetical protein (147) ;mRNA; f:1678408-1678996
MAELHLDELLIWLLQVDVDACHCLRWAAEVAGFGLSDLRNHFLLFAADHSRHVNDLSDLIRSLGHTPVEALASGMATPKGLTHVEMLTVMRENERIAGQAYEEALSWKGKLPLVAEELLVEHSRADEQRHSEYLGGIVAGLAAHEV